MNDRIETLAIKKALGEDRARRITISSTKSMTGHMLGAAGGAEAVASVLALRDGGMKLKEAVRRVADDTGLPRNALYDTALKA